MAVLSKSAFKNANYVKIELLIKHCILHEVLKFSGTQRWYVTPMRDEDLDQSYKPIWLRVRSLDEARSKLTLSNRHYGLARKTLRSQGEENNIFAVRVLTLDFHELLPVFMPNMTKDFVHSRLRYKIFPTPYGASREVVSTILSNMQWKVRPLVVDRSDPCAWIVGSEDPPPFSVLSFSEGDILIEEIPRTRAQVTRSNTPAPQRWNHFRLNDSVAASQQFKNLAQPQMDQFEARIASVEASMTKHIQVARQQMMEMQAKSDGENKIIFSRLTQLEHENKCIAEKTSNIETQLDKMAPTVNALPNWMLEMSNNMKVLMANQVGATDEQSRKTRKTDMTD